ncbi:MAG TPA: hypothetical protein VM070_09210 [Candidatus Saccharimonadales bacterium]|nr:hypothetical protein [Candidatus Saccharimonadales bacterium]
MERVRPVDTATLRAARVVGAVCALAFLLPVILSVAFPSAFLFPPYHPAYQRMLGAIFLSFSLGLGLALRDPARNAGVYAVIGLGAGFLSGATVYTLLVDGADPGHWLVQVPLLSATALALVVTYTRLRRPHRLIVRIVVVAVLLFPLALFLYDLALRSFVAPGHR